MRETCDVRALGTEDSWGPHLTRGRVHYQDALRGHEIQGRY
jgi:hypothetical protein